MDFSKFPKVELHLHLDCSLSYSVVSRLNPTITYEEYLETFFISDKCTNLTEGLICAVREIELMQTEEALRLVTMDLFEQLQARQHFVCRNPLCAAIAHRTGALS